MHEQQVTEPDLTAYALGEMNAEEAARVEAMLAHDAEAQAEVENIRQTAQLITDQLGGEAISGLNDDQKAAIDRELATVAGETAAPKTSILGRIGPMSALAACLLAAACLWVLNRPGTSDPATIAKTQTPSVEMADDQNHAARPSVADQVAQIREQNQNARDLKAGKTQTGNTKLSADAVALAEKAKDLAAGTALPQNVSAKRGGKLAEAEGRLESSAGLKAPLKKNAPAQIGQATDEKKAAFANSAKPAATTAPAPKTSVPGAPALRIKQETQPLAKTVESAKMLKQDLQRRAIAPNAKGQQQAGQAAGAPAADAAVAIEALSAPAEFKEQAKSRKRIAGGRAAAEGDHVVIWPPRPPIPPRPHPVPVPPRQQAGNEFEAFTENPYTRPVDEPRSTLSADVDTASFAVIRRFLMQEKQMPPANAVRIEEMVNYFRYDYAAPKDKKPFAAHVEIASAPWAPKHRLVRIGLQAKHLEANQRPQANLVFLIDVSGSMRSQDKLPLLKQSLNKLVETLDGDDRIAIVTYSGQTRLALASTPVGQKQKILNAIDTLRASGSTNGGAGIQLAYKTAKENFIKGGVNRVVMTTDGDFNVGITNRDQLNKLIEDKRRTGVYLSVLGFGLGNLKDATMKDLAKRGNGNYAYIDRWEEGHKVLVEEAGSTLVPIAKDVKFDVEFNPATVGSYRLIGYEKRKLAAGDFNDDTKDAGEVGSDHTVTVLYEVLPKGVEPPAGQVDPLRYTKTKQDAEKKPNLEEAHAGEIFFVRIRYKNLNADKSTKLAFPVQDSGTKYAESTDDFKLAATTVGLGLMLRNSKYKGDLTYAKLLKMAETVVDARKEAAEKEAPTHRRELIKMIRQAKMLSDK